MPTALTSCNSYRVFRRENLSTVSGFNSISVSERMPVEGNRVVLAGVLTVYAGTTPSLTLSLDISNDGQTWKSTGPSTSFLGAAPNSIVTAWIGATAGFVRARAVLTGTNATATFDAFISFSDV